MTADPRFTQCGSTSPARRCATTLPRVPTQSAASFCIRGFGAGGSSNSNGIAQVVGLANQQLTVSQQLDWDEHFDPKAPYVSFDEKSETFVFRSAHYLPGDAHCCVSAMDVVNLRWNGTRSVQSAVSTALTEYGIENQKELSLARPVDH